jgi:hypothetical protein
MFCICAAVVMILVSFALCYARLCFHFTFICFLSRKFLFSAFKQVLCLPSSACPSVCCDWMCHPRVTFCLFVDVCANLVWAFIYSSTCVLLSHGFSFCTQESDTQLFIVLWIMCVQELFAY